MIIKRILNNRDEWLEIRKTTIGGSECASILGVNPFCSNVELWRRKTGRVEAPDISDKACVRFGNTCEPIIRELFQANYPGLTMHYEENNNFINEAKPYASASLDGWLEDENGRLGIWECKTSEITNQLTKDKWKEQIPQNYYCQLLHYLNVIDTAEFAILTALLTWKSDGKEVYQQVRNYRIEREDVQGDIDFLAEKEAEFYNNYILADIEPPLILPGI